MFSNALSFHEEEVDMVFSIDFTFEVSSDCIFEPLVTTSNVKIYGKDYELTLDSDVSSDCIFGTTIGTWCLSGSQFCLFIYYFLDSSCIS